MIGYYREVDNTFQVLPIITYKMSCKGQIVEILDRSPTISSESDSTTTRPKQSLNLSFSSKNICKQYLATVRLEGIKNWGYSCLQMFLNPSHSIILNGFSSKMTNIAKSFLHASTLNLVFVAPKLPPSPLVNARVV